MDLDYLMNLCWSAVILVFDHEADQIAQDYFASFALPPVAFEAYKTTNIAS